MKALLRGERRRALRHVAKTMLLSCFGVSLILDHTSDKVIIPWIFLGGLVVWALFLIFVKDVAEAGSLRTYKQGELDSVRKTALVMKLILIYMIAGTVVGVFMYHQNIVVDPGFRWGMVAGCSLVAVIVTLAD